MNFIVIEKYRIKVSIVTIVYNDVKTVEQTIKIFCNNHIKTLNT